jgi:hypothetical protein
MSVDEDIAVRLKVGIVNHDLIYDAPKEVKPGIDFNMAPYAAELVSWTIIQTPAVSITDQGDIPYTIAQSLKGNYVFFPRFEDPFTNNLFRGSEFSRTSVAMNDHFSKGLGPVAHMPDAQVTPELVDAVQEYQEHVTPAGDLPVAKQDSILSKIWEGAQSVAA